jgi:uncharacterized protein
MRTLLLLCISNAFITVAWYGHLKHRSAPILEAIVLSLADRVRRILLPGTREFTGYQLKII